GPSPAWLRDRLATIGVASINNVVDVTNYVLFECGQPLHAFDLAKLAGHEIVVRQPRLGERLEAIDHRVYELGAGMCVIADAQRPVGIGGVMGGAATEVTAATTDVLIEAAAFDPMSIRNTARLLNLHSDSSYRFERGLDPQGIDWASRRCCELILATAGGQLAKGVIDVGPPPVERASIVLRLPQIPRVLGIEIAPARIRVILEALGCRVSGSGDQSLAVTPPSWRADLTREIDLVEEVARVHGYEEIPEDVQVPMAASARTPLDRLLTAVRQALVGCGFDEAYTLSVVDEPWSEAFSPWTSMAALHSQTPVLRRADRLRRSLIPSLLGALRTNESLGNRDVRLFEIAKVYWQQADQLPAEPRMVGLASGGDFFDLKGVVETLLATLHAQGELTVSPAEHPLFEPGRGVELLLAGERLGFLGELSATGRKQFDLRDRASVAELAIDRLLATAVLVPKSQPISQFPSIERDLNLVVADNVRWADVERVVREAAGALLARLEYRDTYRDAERLGAGRKSLLLSIELRDAQGTLTGAQADEVRDRIVTACRRELAAELRE
ncbi:MAG: phenylalanine--tRNA ligase subunit beta, partial [Pirellulales bacterium]